MELFSEHDDDKDGILTLSDFPAMLDRMLETPKEQAMVHPEEVGFYNLLFCGFNVHYIGIT